MLSSELRKLSSLAMKFDAINVDNGKIHETNPTTNESFTDFDEAFGTFQKLKLSDADNRSIAKDKRMNVIIYEEFPEKKNINYKYGDNDSNTEGKNVSDSNYGNFDSQNYNRRNMNSSKATNCSYNSIKTKEEHKKKKEGSQKTNKHNSILFTNSENNNNNEFYDISNKKLNSYKLKERNSGKENRSSGIFETNTLAQEIEGLKYELHSLKRDFKFSENHNKVMEEKFISQSLEIKELKAGYEIFIKESKELRGLISKLEKNPLDADLLDGPSNRNQILLLKQENDLLKKELKMNQEVNLKSLFEKEQKIIDLQKTLKKREDMVHRIRGDKRDLASNFNSSQTKSITSAVCKLKKLTSGSSTNPKKSCISHPDISEIDLVSNEESEYMQYMSGLADKINLLREKKVSSDLEQNVKLEKDKFIASEKKKRGSRQAINNTWNDLRNPNSSITDISMVVENNNKSSIIDSSFDASFLRKTRRENSEGSESKMRLKLNALNNDKQRRQGYLGTQSRKKSEPRENAEFEKYIDPSNLERRIMEIRESSKKASRVCETKSSMESNKKPAHLSRKGSIPSEYGKIVSVLGPNAKKNEKAKFIKAASAKRRSFSLTQPVNNVNPINTAAAKTKEEIFTTCQDLKVLNDNYMREEQSESKYRRNKGSNHERSQEKKGKYLEGVDPKMMGKIDNYN